MRTEFVETKLRILETVELPEESGLKELLDGRGYYNRSAESVWLVAYDSARNVRTVNEVARGSNHQVEVSIPTLMSALWAASADRFLLIHNHPSGMVLPSELDIDASSRVMVAANSNGVYYEDFVIIGPGEALFSFAESGLLIPATPKQAMAAFGEPIVLRDIVAELPLPNARVAGYEDMLVIASTYYTDEQALLLMLYPAPPYFAVAMYDLGPGRLTILGEHENIVPAVRQYEDSGGDY